MTRLLRKRLRGVTEASRTQPWREVDYCALDFETTGLDLVQDEIVSYGSVDVRGGRVQSATAIYELACPSRRPSPEAVSLHALRAADCVSAPGDLETAAALGKLLDNKVLIAHAAWIEMSFLKRYLALERCRPGKLVVDTAALARASGIAPARTDAEPGLEWLTHQLGIPGHTPHHALGDAMTTAVVFVILAGRMAARDPELTLGDLVDVSRAYQLR